MCIKAPRRATNELDDSFIFTEEPSFRTFNIEAIYPMMEYMYGHTRIVLGKQKPTFRPALRSSSLTEFLNSYFPDFLGLIIFSYPT